MSVGGGGFGGGFGQPNQFGGGFGQPNQFGGGFGQPNQFGGGFGQPNQFGGGFGSPPASGGTGNSPFTSDQPQTGGFQQPYGGGFQQPFGGGFQQPFGGFGGGFQQPQFGGFGGGFGGGFSNPFGAMMSGLGGLFGGYRAMPFGGYQSMPQPPMNQGPGNAYVQPVGGSPNPRTGVMPSNPLPDPNAPPPGMELNPDYSPPAPGMFGIMGGPSSMRYRPIQGGTIAPETPRAPRSTQEIPLMDDLGPPIGVMGGGDEYWGPGGIRDQQREETRNWYESRGMNPPQQAALLPAVGSSSPYLNMQGLGGLFGGGRGIGIAPPSQAQRYDPYSFNPQAEAQRQQQQMLMDREANTTDYQRLMQRKNSASAGPYVNPLTGAVGGVNPFSQVQDAEIARSLGWQDPNMMSDMRAKMPHEYEAENAARNAKAKEYLNSIGYGTEGFDSSKYEVRRQPIGPSPGLSGLFSGLF